MNSTTKAVLDFLDAPGLDFGTSPLDLEMLQDPALTRELTLRLLGSPLPSEESRLAAAPLFGHLDEVDWDAVSQGMQGRVRVTDAMFDMTAKNAAKADS